MSDKKGLTLLELVAVMIIVGIIVTFAITNYQNMIVSGSQIAALNNLNTIRNAQSVYYLNNGHYCFGYNQSPASPSCTSIAPDCGSTLAALNCNLGLNIADPNHYYVCNIANTGNSNPKQLECQSIGYGENLWFFSSQSGWGSAPGTAVCANYGSPETYPYCPPGGIPG